jgi:hypothetical protein
MSQHHFKVALAVEFGIEEAVMLDEFYHQIKWNTSNERNYHDGRFWTYNSQKSYAKTFPYMSEGKIKRTISNLVKKGILMKGNFNANQYDRTNWYAFTDYGLTIVQKCYIDWLKMANGRVENSQPIPTAIPTTKTTISFTPSGEGTEDGLFDNADTSTLTMLSSESLPCTERPTAPTAEEFEDLWLMYGRKGNKAKAKQEFAKLTADEIGTMRCHIPAYIQSRTERRFCQDFERYIKHKTFLTVIYSKNNEVLYDPESMSVAVADEVKEQNNTLNINGTIYR